MSTHPHPQPLHRSGSELFLDAARGSLVDARYAVHPEEASPIIHIPAQQSCRFAWWLCAVPLPHPLADAVLARPLHPRIPCSSAWCDADTSQSTRLPCCCTRADSPTLETHAQPAPAPRGPTIKLKFGGSSAPVTAAPVAAPAPPVLAPPTLAAAPAVSAASHNTGAHAGLTRHGGQPNAVASGSRGFNVVTEDGAGEDRVSAVKYRKLKKLYYAAVESRDDASLALHRAQKLIHRLREDKSALLDRVIELEMAAGLTSQDVSVLRDESYRTEHERAFPLLHPPVLPSLEDRPRKLPVLTTNTDMSGDDYNKPLGPAPLPKTFSPRQRSQHLRTAVAAQKLRDEYNAQRIAHGLPRPTFPAVAVLGLQGSTIAANVERALSGETLEVVSDGPRGGKRRREDSQGAGGRRSGRPSTGAEPAVPAFDLPNPFASIGAAVPVGATMARNNAEALAAATAAEAPPVAAPAPGPLPVPSSTPAAPPPPAPPAGDIDVAMDDDAASVGSAEALAEDDGGDYKPRVYSAPASGKRGRKSETGASRPKKVRQHNLTSGTFAIPHIARNADGTPRLPLSLGIIQVRALGTINPGEYFHTERYIFPVGYEATRRYPSMIDPNAHADYTCRIVDGGNNMPLFEMYPSDQPGVVITSGTPTGAWTQVLKATMKIRNKQHSGSVSGPDYFGLANNTVKALIQELPGADQCAGYIWQTFVEEDEKKGAAKKPVKRRPRAQAGYEGSPEADDGYANGQYGYENGGGDYGSLAEYGQHQADIPTGAYPQQDYQPHNLQHLLAASTSTSAAMNPYDIPTSHAPQSGGPIDPYLGMGGHSAPFDPYAISTSQPMLDPSFGGAGSAYTYPPGGQPVEYPSSDDGSA